MRLRARLALTVLAAAAPLLAGVAWLRGDLERRDADRALREFALVRMESGGRDRCEADPAFFAITASPLPRAPDVGGRPVVELGGGSSDLPAPLPPVPPEGGAPADVATGAATGPVTQLWAYADDLTSMNPRAPAPPDELVATLRSGGDAAGAAYVAAGGSGRQVLVRTPWRGGPCAFVFVRRIDPAPGEFASFPIWSAVALVAAMVGVVAFAAGSVVRRIRKLTADVGRSADQRYASPVDERGADEISDLARAFNAAGHEIRGHLDDMARREETLRTFLANTTHDVMTPLAVLQGHLSAMRKQAAEGRPADAETATAAVEEAHYLGSLVHNLSAVAKLDAGPRQVHLAPMRVDEVVQRVVERHWPLASPRAIEIECAVPEEPVWFDADVTLFEQAVSNVVGNAVRYNRAGGHVAVLLEEPSATEFSIRVIDDGPGVSDEALAKLGSREYRTDEARRRNPEGSGLGLDIARRVASFHRVKLSFRKSEYGGLEVEFRGVRSPAPRISAA
ncbi:MAG: HAMP domain-containing histidine kinase [Planctomycetes bacterium]|nr:HAMP domain-containing histidine kinase [Planctomycetota bacterium]